MIGPIGGVSVLDLYAGSGALGIEALSRGAERAVFVERHRLALGSIEDNLRALSASDRATVVAAAVDRSIERVARLGPFGLVLVDPPYADVPGGSVPRLLEALRSAGAFAAGGQVVLEHATRDAPPPLSGAAIDRTRRYGDTSVTRYRVE